MARSTAMKWLLDKVRRPHRPIRRQPQRSSFRPQLEYLETRLAPANANVDVLSWHYDNTLSGWNNQETILTPSNVNPASFGRQISYPVNGYVYAQPLYKANLNIAGGTHNVVFVATEGDTVYAFDADNANPATGGGMLWQRPLLIPRAGFTVTTVPSGDTGSGDIVPQVGITGTPVIQTGTNTMYVLAKTKETETVTSIPHYIHRLYALDIANGNILRTVTVGDTINTGDAIIAENDTDIRVTGANTGRLGDTNPPTGPGVQGGEFRFNSRRALHRGAVALAPPDASHPNGVVYMDFASHGDNGNYRGWVIGYDPQTFQLQQFFLTALDTRGSGIWQSGSPVAIDAQNNLFFATGNGFGVTTGTVGLRNLTESVVKIGTDPVTGRLVYRDSFIPFNWQALDAVDADLGSGGTLILPDAVGDVVNPVTGQRRRLIVETGKEGKIYLLDRDDLGGLSPSAAAETARIRDVLVQGVGGVWASPAFMQTGPNEGLLFYHGSGTDLRAFLIRNGQFVRGTGAGLSVAQSNVSWPFPGSQPSISSDGTNNPIIWELQTNNYNPQGPETLYAWSLTIPSSGTAYQLTQLYNSNQVGLRDVMGPSVKFVVPVITNGKVFAGTNNRLEIFGLFPLATEAPTAPMNLTATSDLPSQITLRWTNGTIQQNLIRIERSLDGVAFSQVQITGGSTTSFVDTNLAPATRYFYRVRSENNIGPSPNSNVADARTRIPTPALVISDVTLSQVNLAWNSDPLFNDHFTLERSTTGGLTWQVIAPSLPPSQTTYSDTSLANGTYQYRLTAFNTSGETSVSTPVRAVVGPVVLAYTKGFTSPVGLALNGIPRPALLVDPGFLLLTTGGDFNQAASAFATTRVGINNFTTTFSFRLHDGTDPRRDGFVFVIHADPTGVNALGPFGGGLGYGPDQPNVAADPRGIRNSVAIKFDLFSNAGEGINSTGIFTDGRSPTVRRTGLAAGFPDQTISLIGTGINLNNQAVKVVTLTYDGTTLTERLHNEEDTDDDEDVVINYTVDIRALIGSDTAYVGFTGATSAQFTVVQDIHTWRWESTQTAPTAPSNLRATNATSTSISLAWNANNPYTSTNFLVERSTNGTTFSQIASISATNDTYTDSTGLTAGALYYYRVRSTNGTLNSAYSSIVSATAAPPALLDFANGFANHSNLTANGSATFAPEPGPVGVFLGHQDIGTQGNPGIRGNATFASGTYTLTATGSDIWGTADHFHYVYRPLVGDGEIVARLVSATAQDFWTKTGLMIRENLTAGSRNDFMFEAPRSDHEEPVLQWRNDLEGDSADTGGHGLPETPRQGPPIWLRLVRIGNSFTGYWATDLGMGTHGPWNPLGPNTTVMSNAVYVGLALTSHNNGAVATATFDNLTITGTSAALPPTVARLTDVRSAASSTFTNNRVGIGYFNTSFTFQAQSVIGSADGLTFTIHNDPRGATALGTAGGGLGYGGIQRSVSIKFDLYTQNTHNSTTGLYINGATGAAGQIDMTPFGIILGSNHPIQVNLTYDGSTLLETVTDTLTGARFFQSYAINIPQVVGSNLAYVGFTGGTGGESAIQDIVNWTAQFFQPPPQTVQVLAMTGFPSLIPGGAPGPLTVTARDVFGDTVTGYRGTIHFTSSDPAAVLPADYTFVAADNGAHTFNITLNTPGTQSITATDTVTATISGTQSGISVLLSGGLTIDFANGFSNHSSLTANGDAFFTSTNSPVGIFAGHQDIGTFNNPTTAGNATFSSTTGAYTLSASGSDIWDNADHFHYVYKPLVGNGEIIARVVSATAQDFWTKAGVMIRTDLSSRSANDFMMYTPRSDHQEPVFQWRDNFNGGSGDSRGGGIVPATPMPIWLRLNRTGNVFTGSWAVDNTGAPGTWQVITTHTTVMPTTVIVGLALTAHDANPPGALATAVFDNVTITGTTTPLAPGVARLTDQAGGEAGSIFTNSRVLVNVWTTTFLLKDTPFGNPADSLSFVLHNDPRGAKAVGGGGGGGGYAGITNSIAIKFDLWSHNDEPRHATTGLFTNGLGPDNDRNADIALPPGMNLGSTGTANPLQVTLSYNGTTLTETIRDTVTGVTFAHDYLVNIPQILGSLTAYVGFTGGTGGAVAIQDILSWTGQFPSVQQPATYFNVSPTLPGNLVTNGGFETGDYTGWTRTGDTGADSVITATTAGAAGVSIHSGTRASRLGPNNLVFLTQTLATTAGVNYTLSFWLSNPIGGPATQWLVRVGGNTLMDVTNAPSFTYRNFTFTFTAASSSTQLQFGFAHPPDWFYLDDVSVTPTNATAGAPFDLTVTSLDVGGHRLPYTGTVRLTSTDPQFVPFNYTFTASDNGQHTIPVTLKTAGNQTVFVTDTASSLLVATAGIGVNPAAASTITASNFPSPMTAGDLGSVLVTAKDAFGNVATGYTGTVHLTSSDSQASLQGDHTFTAADAGRFSFGAILRTAGTQSITATDTSPSAFTDAQTITVTPAAAASLRLSGLPSEILSGATGNITVTAYDRFDNPGAIYTGTVQFSSSDSQATLPAGYTFTTADRGARAFPVRLVSIGSQSLTVADPANGFTATQSDITVNPLLVLEGFPATTTAGTANTFTVSVKDANGNVFSGYAGTVHFTSSDAQAVLPDDYTFVPEDGGTRTFSATLRTAGSQSITATDTANGNITGALTSTVTPDVAVRFAIYGYPFPVDAGSVVLFTVTAVDAYGNSGAIYAGTVHFTSSAAEAGLPPDYAFTSADGGTHTFEAVFSTPELISLIVTDTLDATLTGEALLLVI